MSSSCGFRPSVVGDPVDTFNGAVLERKLEFRLIGPLQLSWWRYYDSGQSQQRYSLGWGHAHEFDCILYLGDDATIYGYPVGQQVSFPSLGNNDEEAVAQGYTLCRRSATRYELHRHGEPSLEFAFVPGSRRARPCRLFTVDGEIRLFHTAKNKLERVVHSTGAILIAGVNDDGLLTELMVERPNGDLEPLLTYTYDQHGNLVRTRDGRGHGYELTYDAANRLVRRRGRKGFTFRYQYDEVGRCVFSAGDDNWYGVALRYDSHGRTTRVQRPDGGVWTYKFLPGGKLHEIHDPLNGVQKFLYDALGRATHEVDPMGNVTEYVLDAAGASVRKILPTGQIVSLPEEQGAPDPLAEPVATNAAQYQFGRLTQTAGTLPPRMAELVTLALPADAKALATTLPEPSPAITLETPYPVKPLGAPWWPAPRRGRVFNALGKLVEQHDDRDRMRKWAYDASGNLESYRDFDGSTWRYDYGRWHLLRSITTPIGATTRFCYTTNERIADCLDPGGTLSEYRYDRTDRLIEVRRHGAVRESYVRDHAGNLLTKRAADGRMLLEREMGPGNLLARRRLSSGEEHSFTYDRSGRCVSAATAQDAVTRSYRATGALATELRNGQGLEFRHNGGGEPVDAVWFDRFTVRYERLDASCLVITDPTGGRHRIRWLDHGFMAVEFANGSLETSQYDERGRCLFKCLRRTDGTRWSRQYHWSGEGELRLVKDNLAGEIHHYYDAAHRLAARSIGGQIEHYRQDQANNLMEQPGLTGVVLQEGNRLAEANGLRFEYNDRNHVARCHGRNGTSEYTYDSCDLLVKAVTPEGTWTAEYDALGRRTRKVWQGRATEFHWFGDQLIAETSSNGRLRLYVYADQLALTPLLIIDYESADAPIESGRVGVVLADQIGTPVRVESQNGETLWQALVSPFGVTQIAPSSQIEFSLGFPGHYSDPEIGLHYNRFRYYSPVLGRYLQSDPWGIYGGTNLYAYRTNPLLAVDIRGRGDESTSEEGRPAADEEGTRANPLEGDKDGAPGNKPLKDMTPEELKAHVEQRADALRQAFKAADPAGEERTTLSVGVVESNGVPETRRVVVSTSADDQRLPVSVRKALAPGEHLMQGPPYFVRQKNPGHDPSKPTGPDNPRTRVHEANMDTGQIDPQPYDKAKRGDPPSGTRHHAEQRMEMGAADGNEHVLAQQPTKPCCSGCRHELGSYGKLSKVPNP